MDYEKFIDEVQRRADLITRGQTKLFAGSYLEILRERLSGEKSDRLAAHLPEELAGHLEGGGGGGKFSVCEFYERFAQRAGIAPEEATRHARHIGDALSGALRKKSWMPCARSSPPSTGSYQSACSRILTSTDRESTGPPTL